MMQEKIGQCLVAAGLTLVCASACGLSRALSDHDNQKSAQQDMADETMREEPHIAFHPIDLSNV